MGSLLCLLLFSGLLWYVTTDSFQQMVRGRIIAAIERATGGRVELGSFHAIPLRLEVEVRDLTIHGRESAGDVPYAHVDRISAIVNLSSVLGARISLHSLTLQHPVVHIRFYPDGSTNQPNPKQQGAADFERLFSFSVARLEVRQGELLWQDQRLPLDFTVNDIAASMHYSFLHRRYSGNLAVGRAEAQYSGYRRVPWTGRANFAIDRNGIVIQSLRLSSEGSRLSANGTVANFRNPVFKGNYDLVLDLAQVGAVSRQGELKAGRLQFGGSGSWSRESFSSSGTFDVRDLFWQDRNISARNASASGKFSLSPEKVSLSQIEGKALRGSFSSEAEILNWQAPPTRVKNSRTEQAGVIKIKARDISVTELLRSLGPQFRPVNQLRLAGNLAGTSEVRWRQSIRNAQVNIMAEVARPSRTQAGQIPLAAKAQATYSLPSGEMALTDFGASTPATQIHASGALSSSSTLKFSFTTTDVGEWQPFTTQLFPGGVPFVIHGRATLNGSASGRPSNAVLAGNLQVEDFDVLRPGSASIHADSLSTDFQASSRSLSMHSAVLHRGASTVRFEGNAGLVAWKLLPESSFRLRLDVQNADAGDMVHLAGYDYSIAGTLNGRLTLSGTEAWPQGEGKFALMKGSVEGYGFDSATGVLSVDGDQLTLKNVEATSGAARIAGEGTYRPSSRAFTLRMTATNVDLAQLSPLPRSRIKIAGKLDLSAQARGTTAQPDVTADLHLRNLTFNEELAGDYRLNMTSHGPDLRLTGHSEFGKAELSIDGNVQLRDQWPARVGLHFNRLDVDSLLESYLHGHVTGHSAVAGDLLLEGPLRNLQQMSVTGNLTDFYAEIRKIKLRNDGPIRFALSGQALKVENFHILGENTDFSGSGSIQFVAGGRLDFQTQGKIDLKLIQAYDPDFTSSGTLTGEASVTGALDAPLVRGKLQIQNAAISNIKLPNALSEINGTLLFNQNQIIIESLGARTGGGSLSITGHAELSGRQIHFDLGASAQAVRLRYPPGVSSTANADLHWTGSSTGSLLSGDITIIKLGVTPGFDFGAYLERGVQAASLPQTDPVLNKIRLDLHVVTTPELQMQTSVVRLQGEADLRVRGNAAKPVLLGRADVFEGEAYLNGTKYRLERGGVTFTNPAVTTPFLDMEAITRIRDYDITLSLNGDISKPNGLKTNYRSDPPLPTGDIIALLAFGQTTEESAQLQQSSQSAFSQQASNAMLAAALNATLNNRTQRLFGNSRIKVDPQGLVTETSPTQSGPAVTIEQQVKDNLTLTYTTNVAQTSQQVIRAEYNVTRNVSIVAIRDQNGVVSFDVKIRRRKR